MDLEFSVLSSVGVNMLWILRLSEKSAAVLFANKSVTTWQVVEAAAVPSAGGAVVPPSLVSVSNVVLPKTLNLVHADLGI